MNKGSKRLLGSRRARLVLAMALAAPLAALALASPALATPKGIFSVFSDCPAKTPGVALCTFAQTKSGEFTIGKTTVPINKTITLQGGAVWTGNEENFKEYFLIPASDGNSLSKTELNVPGGLLGLINCTEIKGSGLFEVLERGTCKAIFENGTTGVTATTELVANTHNPAILNLVALSQEEGTALTLPVRVHLKNPLLGEECYIGSATHPVQLHLTTGTTSPPSPNKPISGARGEAETLERNEQFMLRLFENKLVDNAWGAPEAEGCGEFFSFLIDPLVDAKLGLPSAAGHNTAILTGELKTATVEAVLANEV
jgi:hypothetical protein